MMISAPVLGRWVAAVPAFGLMALVAAAEERLDTSGIVVKRALVEVMTPAQLDAHKQRLARNFSAYRPPGARVPNTPGDVCPAATYECVPFPSPISDTTVGAADDYDLPPRVVAPTCTAPTNCIGAGPAASLPRGAIYTGTGTAQDRAWRIRTDGDCTLSITATPLASWDLALIVYEATCSDLPSDCVCVDDTGLPGVAEHVTLQAMAGIDYFIVVDGYGDAPPGPSGPYELNITGSGCSLCPVELLHFTIQ